MIHDEIKRILFNHWINHCGPVLFGSKPSALFVIRTEECYSCLLEWVNQCDEDTSSIILRNTRNGLLVLFYRISALKSLVMEPDMRQLLRSFGYPASSPGRGGAFFSPYFEMLKERFLEGPDFPHEIGFFLGYPSADVLGFIRNKGKNYKYCGLWKVYGDVKKARELFQHYEECRKNSKKYLYSMDRKGLFSPKLPKSGVEGLADRVFTGQLREPFA
jgi:hypothetical protein